MRLSIARRRRAVLACCLCAAGLARAAEQAGSPVARQLQELAARVIVEPRSPQHLLLLDWQDRLPADRLEALRATLELDLAVPVRLQRQPPPAVPVLAAAAAWRAAADTNCVAFAVLAQAPAAELPGLLLALDSRWAVVNVDALGGPGDAERLARRLSRQLCRAFGTLFGVGFSADPHDVMKPLPLGRPEELDILSRNFSPDSSRRFVSHATAFGLRPVTRITYRQQVRMGRMPPLTPRLWPAWEATHKKKVADAFRELGLDPEAAMAELVRRAEEQPKAGEPPPAEEAEDE